MSHYPDERAAEQAAASTEQQPEMGAKPVTKSVPPSTTVSLQYLFGFILIFIDWRLALVFWLVATSNHLLSGLLFRLLEAVENGNSSRGR
jgi:hypothetical protein